ncbi:hypothetical protein SARC_06221 [Sphaeroforma arctica JP610]|uniref:Uncharacterized protein n=1 Tax=Sphaeroforma arctica JP610 TaxID=667725 RepID=A0A0L0FX89_9EUKA|nr:hypothetical protein SARC_06221 [Sphaeroforma arctica JP610]KNC81452.1 hypothetical protein SARC_06221 [Sphaeroforma arctica JP610]|eukprot:XP_014155354.1 hypothetical protein SARC_06221 [Sphaeroforma arctica JP610]
MTSRSHSTAATAPMGSTKGRPPVHTTTKPLFIASQRDRLRRKPWNIAAAMKQGVEALSVVCRDYQMPVIQKKYHAERRSLSSGECIGNSSVA